MDNDDATEIKVSLARMEGKQDAAHTLLSQHLLDDKELHSDFEQRIRGLEKTKWKAHGLAAAAGGVVAYVVTFFKQGGP